MTLLSKKLDNPDESRNFTHGELSLVNVGGVTVGRVTFQPGWQWSKDIKPLAGTDSCKEAHTLYALSGRLHIVMDDGEESDVDGGDVAVISPGHDAWVVGDEPFRAVDWSGVADYAKPAD